MNRYNKKILCLVSLILTAVLIFPVSAGKETSIAAAVNSNIQACGTTQLIKNDIKISSRFWELFTGSRDEDEKTVLIPGGMIFGTRVKQEHVTVTDNGGISSIKSGDILVSLDGYEVSSISAVRDILKECGGKAISAVFKRSKSTFKVNITPKSEDGEYKLGITLRDGAAGIGTITYIDPKTGNFGGLGHGICDADTGDVIEISSGVVTGVILGGVQKGAAGKPGELSGILNDKPIGTVYKNTECGVFGKLQLPPGQSEYLELPIGSSDTVHTGNAYIYSTVKNGKCTKFNIEITEICSSAKETKSFKIKVTDPALLAITGGIVKGMSGSPIIQDGKLVGAVTHVMVADPTEGYGIFIENMLNAASDSAVPKAA